MVVDVVIDVVYLNVEVEVVKNVEIVKIEVI